MQLFCSPLHSERLLPVQVGWINLWTQLTTLPAAQLGTGSGELELHARTEFLTDQNNATAADGYWPGNVLSWTLRGLWTCDEVSEYHRTERGRSVALMLMLFNPVSTRPFSLSSSPQQRGGERLWVVGLRSFGQVVRVGIGKFSANECMSFGKGTRAALPPAPTRSRPRKIDNFLGKFWGWMPCRGRASELGEVLFIRGCFRKCCCYLYSPYNKCRRRWKCV